MQIFANKLDKALKTCQMGILENLYGFRSVRTDKPIDILINAIDELWADWDFDDPKFQKLATKAYGGEPPKTPQEWLSQIEQSSQSDELKQVLTRITGGQPTAAAPAAAATGLRPGTIYMKRGTVIDADHIEEMSGISVIPPGTMIVAGIGPGKGYTSLRKHRLSRIMNNPRFYDIGRTPVGYFPRDPHHTETEIKRKFGKILTIMPHNINRIDYR